MEDKYASVAIARLERKNRDQQQRLAELERVVTLLYSISLRPLTGEEHADLSYLLSRMEQRAVR